MFRYHRFLIRTRKPTREDKPTKQMRCRLNFFSCNDRTTKLASLLIIGHESKTSFFSERDRSKLAFAQSHSLVENANVLKVGNFERTVSEPPGRSFLA